MTTALITGITGMVGSHLADYLLEHTDWDVVGLQRWRSPLDNIGHLLERANRDILVERRALRVVRLQGDRALGEFAARHALQFLGRVVESRDDLFRWLG